MLRTYFKTGWRNLKRNKAYAFINVLGLSLSMACGILIFALVAYHFSFDDFHFHKDRIYRIVSEFHAETIEYQPGVPQPLGKAFKNDFAFAEKMGRVVSFNNPLISLPAEPEVKKFREEDGIALAEPGFFEIFNFPLVLGNEKTALAEPNTAIVTQQIAKKYFGTENAIGKIIRYTFSTGKIDCKITGILKDLPRNTDRKEQIYLSYDNLKDCSPGLAGNDWRRITSGMQCFVLLNTGVSKERVEKAFPGFVKKYYDAEDARVTRFKLQPISDIHFNADFDGYADKKYLWALILVGLFLVITACVNFINLATAQALNRSREVGVRKVLGSVRGQLFWQFITETALIALFALVTAYVMAQLALPYLNALFKEKLTISLFRQWQLPAFLLLLTGIIIFLSGSYPGLVLARFQPVLALKGKLSQKHIGGFSLRRILVVTQFAISQMLIIGTIVIAGQMHYSKTADLGFNKDAIVMLPVPMNDKVKMNTLHSRLATIPGIEKITFCSQPPASGSNSFTSVRFDNRAKDEPWEINLKFADDQYVTAFGMKLVAGRNPFPSDTAREVLVNETFVKKLNISPGEIIGKTVTVHDAKLPVVGVVKDFYNYSFHSEISPTCIRSDYSNYSNCAVKINAGNTKSALGAAEKIWNETYPDYLYSYQFLDERIARFYELDNIMLKLIETFACIAILIGCLGLYGLVSFMALRKTKEIGVRKVLGANIQSILWLFGKEFSRLLIIAFLIAAPLAWWAMTKYLEDFKYRIQMGAGIFLLAISATFIVATLTIGYRSVKAAIANPVKSIRTE